MDENYLYVAKTLKEPPVNVNLSLLQVASGLMACGVLGQPLRKEEHR
jgi:hypothetical protein